VKELRTGTLESVVIGTARAHAFGLLDLLADAPLLELQG
jgi:hypothetical protein